MTSITTRAGKGSPLTHNEVDANFTNLNNDKLDTAGIALGSAASPTLKFTGDPNTGIYSPGADQLAVSTGGTERARIDSSGRLLVGTSSARSNFFNSTITANILLENDNAVLGLVRNGNNAFSSYLVLAKSRSASNTIVQADDQLGSVNFQGNDGTEFVEAAQIAAFVDGTPGANDMPSRLVFSTTADGAAFTTERLRIDSSGNVGIGTSAPEAAHLLQANGVIASVSSFGSFTALESAGGTGFRWTLANDGTFRLQRTTDNFSTATTPIFIDSSNRVGIGTTSPTTLLDVNADTVRVRTARTPASASATGATGEICWDANYIYVCTATNTWKRSAISTW
jgi:hypothetical protein